MVYQNTIYAWVKNKDKILLSLEKGQNVKRQKLRPRAHEVSDAAVFERFLNMRSQNVPLSGAIIQEKASIYVIELNIETSDGRMVGCIHEKNEEISNLKQFLEIKIPYHTIACKETQWYSSTF